MNRRGFLGLMAGAAVTPAAKLLPAAPEFAALDLSSFNAALKAIYTEDAIRSIIRQEMIYGASFFRVGWNGIATIGDDSGEG